MKIAIIDDSKIEQERLLNCISVWAQSSGTFVNTETFDSGERFVRTLQKARFDVAFMDIIMDGKTGIEAARCLRENDLDTLLIFITTSPEFMAQAFPCHAFDYIMKPYTQERVDRVLDDAKRALGKKSEVIEIAGEKFLLSDILYIYSDSNYCEIYTKRGKRKLRISFTELSEKLTAHPSFMVVGRGAAINFDNTSHISDLDCVMTNGERVPVSRRKIKETEQAFYDRQFQKMLSKE